MKFLGINEKLSVKYTIKNNIEGTFYLLHNILNIIRQNTKIKEKTKPFIFFDMDSYDKIAFIKTLIGLKIINIDIPYELFNIENIEEIENSVRINFY